VPMLLLGLLAHRGWVSHGEAQAQQRLTGAAKASGLRVLDRLLWPRLDASQRTLLRHRCIEIESVETAVRVRLVLGERGFEVARAGLAPVVVIRAQTAALLRLARGEDDADRLFFERRLVMEGDTEFALLLKNTLDAIGPLWAPTPR